MPVLRRIPAALVILRMLLAALLVFIVVLQPGSDITFPAWLIILVVGVLSDVFDGMIARALGVATPRLRQWDSRADLLFWLSQLATAVMLCPEAIHGARYAIAALMVGELAGHVVSVVRFRRGASTHSYLSKLWGLTLMASMLELIAGQSFGGAWMLCVGVGLLSQLEIVAIMVVLPAWRSDVPTVVHALRLKREAERG